MYVSLDGPGSASVSFSPSLSLSLTKRQMSSIRLNEWIKGNVRFI